MCGCFKYFFQKFSATQGSLTSLTVVENAEGGEGAGGGKEEELPVEEVVQPSEEWQTLKPGNVLKGIMVQRQNPFGSVLDFFCACVCVCMFRSGCASRFPCETESADWSEGGPTGRGAA